MPRWLGQRVIRTLPTPRIIMRRNGTLDKNPAPTSAREMTKARRSPWRIGLKVAGAVLGSSRTHPHDAIAIYHQLLRVATKSGTSIMRYDEAFEIVPAGNAGRARQVCQRAGRARHLSRKAHRHQVARQLS
ncbi:hypothetical protein CBM2605_A10035 [Cupriavidus neocaledonicus]|uniref:Uncharacterized protein n=1 Tax=Cupriavidus neocaledonicus TaxID=1040979 RepID=A0ABY1UVF0_9BURK|nr:hypothetical protein CBM2605_A10035 [Cupriavidus neocaledonicus]